MASPDLPASLDRRSFLALLGAGLACMKAPSSRTGSPNVADSGAAGEPSRRAAEPSGRLDRIGIQLYTVRGLMKQDVEGTLAALAGIGYREVELAGLHGRTAKDFRAILDRHGLAAPAGHVSLGELRDQWARVADDAAALGHRYVVCPWIDAADRTVAGYKRVAARLNAAGEAASRAGLQLAYHNHDFEFKPVDGVLPYDLLLAECDPRLVQMELDLFWITKGGHDPLAYFAKHPGRFPMVHVKDMTRDGRMVNAGQGSIDFAAIFARAEQAGIRHYFVEHDDPPSPLADVRASYEHLRSLRIPAR